MTITETLNILETYDTLPPFGSAEYAHALASAYQRAFIDRNSKLGDPAFVQVPLDKLTSKAYARELREDDRADTRDARRRRSSARSPTAMHTTHYSVVDGAGNAVATTTTLNNGYGSGVYLTGPGFFMNDEMDDFAAQPGKPNMFGLVQGEQNAIAPGKRMLSAMSPTIVLDPQGKLLLVVGAAGGPTHHHGDVAGDSQRDPESHDARRRDARAAAASSGAAGHASVRDERPNAGGGGLAARRWAGAIAPVGGSANVNAIMRAQGGWVAVTEPRDRGPSRAVGH